MKKLGEAQGISELAEPTSKVSERISGHSLSMIACGMLDGKAYYRGPYDGGAVFLLITDPAYPNAIVDPVARMLFCFPQLISQMDCDHRQALRGYCEYFGLDRVERDSSINIVRDGMGLIQADFDASGRLANLQATISPM